uniref:Uncharacterized protein n=1 Tax=Ralstonia solanacearum TaxID=305 RepID=A0A0S4TXP1_RALSL|nr:exported protein of unknown function [Ralstonia solanacearum]
MAALGRRQRISLSTACGSPCAIAVDLSVQGKRIMLHKHRECRRLDCGSHLATVERSNVPASGA